MTNQIEGEPGKPHILIVGGGAAFRGRLRKVFDHAGVSCEAVISAPSAVKRLTEGEPPITGVLTDPLEGDYPQVVEAARRIGANVALMTRSSLTIMRARTEGLAAYSQKSLAGDTIEPAVVSSMVAELVSPPTTLP